MDRKRAALRKMEREIERARKVAAASVALGGDLDEVCRKWAGPDLVAGLSKDARNILRRHITNALKEPENQTGTAAPAKKRVRPSESEG